VRLGFEVPVRHDATGELMREFAVRADELGFALWVGDHVVVPDRIASPYPFPDRYRPEIADLFPDPGFVEACTGLAFLAGCTKRALLGVGVLVIPMRNPVLLAKQLASVSVFSGGRVIAGIGVGWMKEEFDALAAPFEHRGDRTDEYVEIMRQLWSADRPVSFTGRFYSFAPLRFRPTPVGGAIPIWVGGHSEPALRRTARYGTGWYAVDLPPEDLRRGYARIRELAQSAGRTDSIELACAVRLGLTGPDISPAIRRVEAYARAGVTHLMVVATTKRTVRENVERMERVWREVVPRVPAD
jgi:probable F420-dependent oxidoreductase